VQFIHRNDGYILFAYGLFSCGGVAAASANRAHPQRLCHDDGDEWWRRWCLGIAPCDDHGDTAHVAIVHQSALSRAVGSDPARALLVPPNLCRNNPSERREYEAIIMS